MSSPVRFTGHINYLHKLEKTRCLQCTVKEKKRGGTHNSVRAAERKRAGPAPLADVVPRCLPLARTHSDRGEPCAPRTVLSDSAHGKQKTTPGKVTNKLKHNFLLQYVVVAFLENSVYVKPWWKKGSSTSSNRATFWLR